MDTTTNNQWPQGLCHVKSLHHHHESSKLSSSSTTGSVAAAPAVGGGGGGGAVVVERKARPQKEGGGGAAALNCPRCNSSNTKFCYYNNYSLSQPRYFCKTCRRYWTEGGTLRNVPVGGGSRKNINKIRSSSSSTTTTTTTTSISQNNKNYNKPPFIIHPTDLTTTSCIFPQPNLDLDLDHQNPNHNHNKIQFFHQGCLPQDLNLPQHPPPPPSHLGLEGFLHHHFPFSNKTLIDSVNLPTQSSAMEFLKSATGNNINISSLMTTNIMPPPPPPPPSTVVSSDHSVNNSMYYYYHHHHNQYPSHHHHHDMDDDDHQHQQGHHPPATKLFDFNSIHSDNNNGNYHDGEVVHQDQDQDQDRRDGGRLFIPYEELLIKSSTTGAAGTTGVSSNNNNQYDQDQDNKDQDQDHHHHQEQHINTNNNNKVLEKEKEKEKGELSINGGGNYCWNGML